ncbi:substrate-binding periplasmic protein [Pseudomonas sp. MBLB4123]|uniref:substrate-binding periplasmic protein n=1 Tax=Pseudomonas sp. MBLB4123 TaxID=3451557 RepID=UPI003F7520D9
MKSILACFLLALCLASAQVLGSQHIKVYAYHLKPPFIVDLQQRQGLYFDFSDYLNSKGDAYRFETLYLPRNRIEHDLDHGHLDGVVIGVNPLWFQDQAQERFLWTPSLYQDQDEIVSLTGTGLNYRGPESLSGLHLAGVLGFSYHGIDDWVAAGKIDRSDTPGEREVLLMLLKGRVDVGIVSRSTLDYLIEREGWQGLFHVSPTPHDRFARRLLLPPGQEALYHYLLPILEQLPQDPAWQAILERYAEPARASGSDSELPLTD